MATTEQIIHASDVTLDDGSVVSVGRLSAAQTLRVARTLAGYVTDLDAEKVAALKAAASAESSSSVADVALMVLELVDDDVIDRVVAIVCGVPEKRIRRVSLEVFVSVFEALVEHNDWQRLVAVFRRAAGLFSAA